MCVKLADDTLSAVWGDTRDSKLNIWFQRMTINGIVLSIDQISSEAIPRITLYPNPCRSNVRISGALIESLEVFDLKGKLVLQSHHGSGSNDLELNVEGLASGTYVIQVKTNVGQYSDQLVKE